jgi:prepilin-type N-terminal cleavage/methylation domain-containing protein
MRNSDASGATGQARLFFVVRMLLVAVLSLAGLSNAQSPQDVRAWFEDEIANAGDIPALNGLGLRVKLEPLNAPPPHDIEQLRRQIADRPDHPLHQQVAQYERIHRGEAGTVRTLWFDRRGWRMNADLPPDFGPYSDTIVVGTRAASFTAKQLTLLEAGENWPPGRNFDNEQRSLLSRLDVLRSGGLARIKNDTIADVQVRGDRWEIVTTGRFERTWRGSWDSDSNRGFISDVSYSVQREGQPTAIRHVWDGWVFEASLGPKGTWIASRVTEYESGRPVRRHTWMGFDERFVGRVGDILRIPRHDREDAARGMPTFTSISDLRADGEAYATLQPEGRWSTMVHRAPPRPWRALGWVAVVSIIATLIAIRLRRAGVFARIGDTMRSSRGFTLTELVLTISLVAILIALMVPNLASVRNQARQIADLANLRSHVSIMHAYSTDFRGIAPFVTDPKATYTILRGGDLNAPVKFFDATSHWHIALADGWYDGQPGHPSLLSPYWHNIPLYAGASPNPAWTSYHYSCNFIARPEYWNPATRSGRMQWRPNRLDEVQNPSSKIMLFNNDAYFMAYRARPDGVYVQFRPWFSNVGLADGSATRITQQDIRSQSYATGDGPEFNGGGHVNPLPPGFHSIDGVRARDVGR